MIMTTCSLITLYKTESMVQAVHCNSTVKCQEPISIVELHMVVDDLGDNEDQ